MTAATPFQILSVLGPSCRDNARRQMILGQTTVNGIDYVEFDTVAGKPTLHVHFLVPMPGGNWNLVADPSPIQIHGGTRIVGVQVVSVSVANTRQLDIVVDQQGDFSPYLLAIGWTRDEQGAWTYALALDRLFSVAPINFRPGCPVDFDCAPDDDCPPDTLAEPALDYLARDYASFRQLLIDLVSQRSPSWTERSPADLGITLLELFATEGDHLAYLQDAVANEAYLDTARQRESAKRHAKLIDYQMHDGRNAQTWVHFAVDSAGLIPAGTELVTRIGAPLRFDRNPLVAPYPQPTLPPGPQIHAPADTAIPYDDYEADPALANVRVFETRRDVLVDGACNELRIHTWGNERCCLPRGATSMHVYAVSGKAPNQVAVRPPITAGDRLVLEEVLGPDTGSPADADPTHRQVVRVKRVSPDPSTSSTGTAADQMHDLLYLAALGSTGELVKVTAPVPLTSTLPLVEVTWERADALTFPLCLSAVLDTKAVVGGVSVARGNVVLADHGRHVTETPTFDEPFGGDRARVALTRGPLTMACPPSLDTCDVRLAEPAIKVSVETRPGQWDDWFPRRDLLESRDTDLNFAVDIDHLGRPTLRFGDGESGRRLVGARQVKATYRIGNGRAGTIGAEGLAHVVVPIPRPGWPTTITLVRNPLPATGAEDPETVEEVRQHAPAAFRAVQFRAVTEADYRAAALTASGVAGAVASFRSTGSWMTVFVGIDPRDPDAILTDPRGHTRLEPTFRDSVVAVLDRYRLAGYDLEVRCARYIPLDITLELCVKAGFFRGDVVEAVIEALARGRSQGRRPMFDPLNFTFGQPVYLSQVYAAVADVEGVDSADIRTFRRHGRADAGERDQGFIPIGPWEIAQLDNDPSRMENGTLTVTAGGGS